MIISTYIFLGNGNCLLSCTLAECDSKVTGACNCSCGTSEEENCWGTSGKTGKFCNCCLRGPCQTHCFNRYANGKDEKNMCSEEGTCSCDFTGDAKQKVGEKCKVIFQNDSRTQCWNHINMILYQ